MVISYLVSILFFYNSFINENKKNEYRNPRNSEFQIVSKIKFSKNEYQTKTLDTITNQQFYKDTELLFKSNFLDSNRFIAEIKTSEKYENLILNMFYDFNNEIIDRKIELICENKILISFLDKNNSRLPFKISKSEIDKILSENLGDDIYIKYFDRINKNGLIIGILKISE